MLRQLELQPLNPLVWGSSPRWPTTRSARRKSLILKDLRLFLLGFRGTARGVENGPCSLCVTARPQMGQARQVPPRPGRLLRHRDHLEALQEGHRRRPGRRRGPRAQVHRLQAAPHLHHGHERAARGLPRPPDVRRPDRRYGPDRPLRPRVAGEAEEDSGPSAGVGRGLRFAFRFQQTHQALQTGGERFHACLPLGNRAAATKTGQRPSLVTYRVNPETVEGLGCFFVGLWERSWSVSRLAIFLGRSTIFPNFPDLRIPPESAPQCRIPSLTARVLKTYSLTCRMIRPSKNWSTKDVVVRITDQGHDNGLLSYIDQDETSRGNS